MSGISKKSRIISAALCIVMLMSIVPLTVWADDTILKNFEKRYEYSADTFVDVLESDWFATSVQSVYEFGLMNGKGASKFDPAGDVTVGETFTIAARLHSIYNNGSDSFASSKPWYQTYIDYCTKNGVFRGNVLAIDGTALANREFFASLLSAAIPDEEFETINTIVDGAIPDVGSSFYINDIYKLYRAGITNGSDSKGTFNPENSIKRREVAAIISRIVDKSLRTKGLVLGDLSPLTPAIDSDSSLTAKFGADRIALYLPFDNSTSPLIGQYNVTERGKTAYTECVYGQGLKLDNANVLVNGLKVGNDSFTVAFWLMTPGTRSDPSLVSNKDWESGNNKGFIISLREDDIKFNLGDGSERMDSEFPLPDGYKDKWMHVLFTVNRDEGVVGFAYDFGELAVFPISDALSGVSFDGISDITIGQDGTGKYVSNVPGYIDDFIILKGAVTAEDIATLASYYGK